VFLAELNSLAAIGRFSAERKSFTFQQHPQSFTDHSVIIRKQYFQRHEL
jgi:hypothetical protein